MSTVIGTKDISSSKEEYMKLLDQILRTNMRLKAAKMMESAIGVKTKGYEPNKNHAQCSLSEAIKSTTNCIKNLEGTGDRIMGSYIATSGSFTKPNDIQSNPKAEFARVSRTMLNVVVETVAISRRLHENSLGLHIAADFLRTPADIAILNYSRSGRVPIQHYSCNEASIMSLTWLINTATHWIKTLQEDEPKVSEESIKAFSLLKDFIMHLKDAAEFASQVFRVLMYCNLEGKIILREYVESLKPDEVNDIITELHTLRRKFDQINIILEQLGWSLADVWTRFTGKHVTFESLVRSSQENFKPFGDGSYPQAIPEGVTNLKNKINAGLKNLENSSIATNVLFTNSKKKNETTSKADQLKQELAYKLKLENVFGVQGGLLDNASENNSSPRSEPRSRAPLASQHKSGDSKVDNGCEDIGTIPVESLNVKKVTRSLSYLSGNKSKSILSRLSSHSSSQLMIGSSLDDSQSHITNRNVILSNLFQEQLQGITCMMTQQEANAARVSFEKFLCENVNEASFNRFKEEFAVNQVNENTSTRPWTTQKKQIMFKPIKPIEFNEFK